MRSVVSRILVRGLHDGELNAEDRSYLAQIVAQRTNLTQPEAEQRVDQVYAKAHQAIEDARIKPKPLTWLPKPLPGAPCGPSSTLLLGVLCQPVCNTVVAVAMP